MQDPSSAYQQATKLQFPEQEQVKCPRCDSTHTKFCYYNNYNLSQPRHFCKNCRRYWTKGGSLRNIPVGGGSRKNAKRSSNNPKRHSTSSSSNRDPNPTRKVQDSVPSFSTANSQQLASNSGVLESSLVQDPNRVYGLSVDHSKMLDMSGSFSSLLTSNGQLGSILEGLNPNGPGLKMAQMGNFAENLDTGHGLDASSGRDPGMAFQGSNNGDGDGDGDGESYRWSGGSSGWLDLAIYTRGSSFQ